MILDHRSKRNCGSVEGHSEPPFVRCFAHQTRDLVCFVRDWICVDPPLCRGTSQGEYGPSTKGFEMTDTFTHDSDTSR